MGRHGLEGLAAVEQKVFTETLRVFVSLSLCVRLFVYYGRMKTPAIRICTLS